MPQVTVTLRGREDPWSKKFSSNSSLASEIVQELEINPLEVLIKVNDEFVPDTHKVKKGDKIDLLEITSRG